MQQHPAVRRHRARNIAERDQIGPTHPPRAPAQALDLTAPAHCGPHGSRPVGQAPPGGCPRPAPRDRAHRQLKRRNRTLCRGQIRSGHLLEIHLAQTLLRRKGQRGVELNLLAGALRPVARRRLGAVKQRFGGPTLRRACGGGLVHAAHKRREKAHHMFQKLRIAPVQPEHLAENHPLLGPRGKAGLKRRVKIGAFGKPRRLDRTNSVDHAPRPHRQPRAAQRPREMRDVFGQLALLGHSKIGINSHR